MKKTLLLFCLMLALSAPLLLALESQPPTPDLLGRALGWGDFALLLLGLFTGGGAAAPVIVALRRTLGQAMVVYDQLPPANKDLINHALENGATSLAKKMTQALPLSEADKAAALVALNKCRNT